MILDHWGVVKADIGVRDGRIVGIGKAGNPDTMDGVDPALVIGPSTEILSGNGRILTAGAIDCHVHLICPQIVDEALASGITTIIGGGTGPADGTKATTVTAGRVEPGADASRRWTPCPSTCVLLGKGNTVSHEALWEQVRGGAGGFKLHEDWGTTPAAIDACLTVADESGVQVAIHTDTLNEAGYVESTLAAIAGRSIHTYHTEGAGGGHAPDIITVASHPNVLPSSTNPTRPHTVNTVAEHLDMLMVCHHLNPSVPEDLAFAESRIRPSTIAAEDVLHDMGAISMIGSDCAGDGSRRRGDPAHVADRARDEAPPWFAARRRRRRQPSRPPLRGQVHDLPGGRPRARPRGRFGRGRQARRPRAVGSAVLRRPPARRGEGRHDRVGADGRCQRRRSPRRSRCSPRPMFGAAPRAAARDRASRSSRRPRSTTGSPSDSR